VGLLRSKLKEFLDLEQGNRSVFNYTRQFNTLAQYGTYHVDTDEKKANLYRAGLTIYVQERLVHLSSLSYNKLASATIDQERMMKVVAEVDEKKRKRMMPGSTAVVVLTVLLRSTTWCIPHLGVSCVDYNSRRIGAITRNSNRNNSSSNSSSSTVPLPDHHSRLQSGHHNSFPLAAFHASTIERWATSLENAAYPRKAIRRELRHPW
jgi:hypothetical protein